MLQPGLPHLCTLNIARTDEIFISDQSMARPTLVKPVVRRFLLHHLQPVKERMRGLRVYVSGSVQTMGKAAIQVGIVG